MAKINTTVQKVTTKTISFAALRRMIYSKNCWSVRMPFRTYTHDTLIEVSKKAIVNDVFKKYKTTDDMFKELEFEKVEMLGDDHFIVIRAI